MIEKSDAKYKALADIFLMYREYGEPKEDKDWDALIGKCHEVIEASRGTKAYKLSINLCLSILDVAEQEFKELKYGKSQG